MFFSKSCKPVAQCYDTLVQRASRILVQGCSVLVDAVFAREAERAAIREAALRQNIPFVGFFLTTDLATRQSRVRHREGDASDATPEIAGLQEQYDIGAVDWDIIDASGTPEQTLELCQARITHREAATSRPNNSPTYEFSGPARCPR